MEKPRKITISRTCIHLAHYYINSAQNSQSLMLAYHGNIIRPPIGRCAMSLAVNNLGSHDDGPKKYDGCADE